MRLVMRTFVDGYFFVRIGRFARALLGAVVWCRPVVAALGIVVCLGAMSFDDVFARQSLRHNGGFV